MVALVIQERTSLQSGGSTIAKYVEERLVLFLDEKEKYTAIERLVDLLDEKGKLADKDSFHSALLEREKLVSTGIGIGVAIPHAKMPGTSHFFIAVGIQRGEGIDWNAIDGSSVRLIFMIGGPDNRQTEYLKLLSQLTLIVKDEQCRKRLLRSTSAREVIDIFSER